MGMEIKIRYYSAEDIKTLIEMLTRNGYRVMCYRRNESVLSVRITRANEQ